jgi:hypothetical protein
MVAREPSVGPPGNRAKRRVQNRANLKVPGIEVMYRTDLGLATAFIGLMVLAVAEVMRHGVRLQDDQDLTV